MNNVINSNDSIISKKIIGRRVSFLILSLITATMIDSFIYDYYYMSKPVSFQIISLLGLIAMIIGGFCTFEWIINSSLNINENSGLDFKDKKIPLIIAISLIIFCIALYPMVRSVSTSSLYNVVDSAIINSYDNKEPKNENYLTFKKDMNENNPYRINQYSKNKNDLISTDSNLILNLVVLSDSIKNEMVRNKFDDIYSDKYISINEYNDFKEFVLKNPDGDKHISELVTR